MSPRRSDDLDFILAPPRPEEEARRPHPPPPPRGRDPRRARGRRHHRGAQRRSRGGRRALAELQPEHPPPGRDRPELVRVRARRLRARLDPGRAQPRAGLEPPDVEVAAARDRLDRGPALLPARRRRLRGHRARRVEGRDGRQGRRGRLDDHAAARPQPLHRPGEDAEAQGERGVSRDQALEQVAEVEDPQRVPEHRLLRQPRLRRRGGLADVLLEARVAADAARVGDARRPAAGAVDLRPVPQPAGSARPPRRGVARDALERRADVARSTTTRSSRTRSG